MHAPCHRFAMCYICTLCASACITTWHRYACSMPSLCDVLYMHFVCFRMHNDFAPVSMLHVMACTVLCMHFVRYMHYVRCGRHSDLASFHRFHDMGLKYVANLRYVHVHLYKKLAFAALMAPPNGNESEQNKLSLLVRHLCDSCCNNWCMASQQVAVNYVNTWQKCIANVY